MDALSKLKAKPETPEATTDQKFKSESCFTARVSKSEYNPAAQGGEGISKRLSPSPTPNVGGVARSAIIIVSSLL